jgi:hypothetical protein
MSNHETARKPWVVMPVFSGLAFLLIIPSLAVILISNNSYFGVTTNLLYAQPDQMNSNITNSVLVRPLVGTLTKSKEELEKLKASAAGTVPLSRMGKPEFAF